MFHVKHRPGSQSGIPRSGSRRRCFTWNIPEDAETLDGPATQTTPLHVGRRPAVGVPAGGIADHDPTTIDHQGHCPVEDGQGRPGAPTDRGIETVGVAADHPVDLIAFDGHPIRQTEPPHRSLGGVEAGPTTVHERHPQIGSRHCDDQAGNPGAGPDIDDRALDAVESVGEPQ